MITAFLKVGDVAGAFSIPEGRQNEVEIKIQMKK